MVQLSGEEADYAAYRSEWWTRYFTDSPYFWPPQLDAAEPKDGYRAITRDGVFSIAATESEHRLLHTAVAAYVWGVGKWAFLVGRQVRAFTRNIQTVEPTLERVSETLASNGPVAAYESMLPGRTNRLPYMGPAYFTKFLFFVGYRDAAASETRPLILDRRVAAALRNRKALDLADGGWSSDTYHRYLSYCHRLNTEDPESVEVELFTEGRKR